MERPKKNTLIDIAALIVAVVLLCLYFFLWQYPHFETTPELDVAEKLMETHPDSALLQLNEVDPASLKTQALKARYALLKTQAVDRNYIDTTDFSILKPALDYYLRKGTPEQKLKTLYYQARIYQNRQELDSALQSLIRAEQFAPQVTDSMMLGRLFQNEGWIDLDIRKYKESVEAHIQAAEYYHGAGDVETEAWCLNTAFEAAMGLKKEPYVRNVLSLIQNLAKKDSALAQTVEVASLRYSAEFKDPNETLKKLPAASEVGKYSDEDRLCIAHICSELGKPELGLYYFNSVDTASQAASTLQYFALKPDLLEKNGKTAEALTAYKHFIAEFDTLHTQIFNSDLLFEKRKFELEAKAQDQKHSKLLILIGSAAVILLLLAGGGILFYYYKASRADLKSKILSLQIGEEKIAELNNFISLYKSNEVALHQEITNIQSENEKLLDSIKNMSELDPEVRAAMMKRVELLNKFLKSSLSDTQDENPEWIKEILKDRNTFMNNTRQFFAGLNPGFIASLKSKCLSDDEINHVCLYLLGMNGKEIQKFTGKSRAYHLASDIRKKLSLDQKEGHLSAYIRNLFRQY